MSTHVLLITRDRHLKDRLTKSLSDFAGETLTIESVDRVSDATQRLKQNDGVHAVIMDWDLPKRRLDADTLIGMVHGAIARKSRERILFCDKARAQMTLNSIGDAVLSTDANWRITFLNPVAEKLIGWTW